MKNMLQGDRILVRILAAVFLSSLVLCRASAFCAAPPEKPAKLIFIHHSCGENWLADGNGGLAKALQSNNYVVSDTNYGWGPYSIGDRTDILNWPEWFTGQNSPTILKALYGESNPNSPYRRTLKNPGGENRIIMFKSCFPNSNLAGSPGDGPAAGSDLTVGAAKAVYNDLLSYFKTRPDKLFIAITAPPVQDGSHARNARAFNTWLTTEWLKKYTGKNVAVFDFYNVLTGSDNHHRLTDNTIDYITDRGKNTLYYASSRDDDHPSSSGNRKATAEFVPLLNYYYRQWLDTNPPETSASTPSPPSSQPEETAAVEAREEHAAAPSGVAVSGNLIDDFEANEREWQVFADESKKTGLNVQRDSSTAHNGQYAMRLDYDLAPDSWATCSLVLDQPGDWSSKSGLSFYYRAEKKGQMIIITAYGGSSPDALSHYEYIFNADAGAVSGWKRVSVKWNQFVQPAWEKAGGQPFDPRRAMGLAFVFSSDENREKGRLWVDEIRFID